MTFIYKKSVSIRDDEAGIEIAPNWGFRDGIDTFNYALKRGDLKFDFDVIYSSVPFIYRNTKNGNEETGRVTDAVYILEQGFRDSLQNAFQKMSKASPTEIDYESFKNILQEGLTALFTRGGETLKDIPGGKFHVEFEANLVSMAKRHPEKLKHFKLSHHEKSSQQAEVCA